jgi:hypothetical protein
MTQESACTVARSHGGEILARRERPMARILVVDDDRLLATAMGERLKAGGHDVLHAGFDRDASNA